MRPFLWGHPWAYCFHGRRGPVPKGQTDPVSPLESVCPWGDVRGRAFGPPAVGEPH